MVGGCVRRGRDQSLGQSRFVVDGVSMGGGALSLGLQANARVDDDKFLACQSQSRQCWAREAWAIHLMSAIGRER